MRGWLFPALAIGGFVTYKITSIVKAFQECSFKLTGAKFVKFQGIDQTMIVVRAKITNPTTTLFRLGTFKGSLKYQGTQIADVQYDGNDMVKANGDTYVNIPFTLTNKTTLQSLKDLLTGLLNGNLGQTITVTGTFCKYGYKHMVNESFTIKDFI